MVVQLKRRDHTQETTPCGLLCALFQALKPSLHLLVKNIVVILELSYQAYLKEDEDVDKGMNALVLKNWIPIGYQRAHPAVNDIGEWFLVIDVMGSDIYDIKIWVESEDEILQFISLESIAEQVKDFINQRLNQNQTRLEQLRTEVTTLEATDALLRTTLVNLR